MQKPVTLRSRSRQQQKSQQQSPEIDPNPRLTALVDFALDQVVARLASNPAKRYEEEWFAWAQEWKNGRRSPARCVDVAHRCFAHRGWGIDGRATDPVHHALGQLAWSGKEACFSTPTSGWLVIRYVADAMIAFGIAFAEGPVPAPEPRRQLEAAHSTD